MGGTPARRDPPFRLGHRPALDGLRGIAVVLVVVYHLGQRVWVDADDWLAPGGFVGVDLFFALSGFLITALLLSELDRRGRIDPLPFLWRRIVRLTPALALVLGVLLVGSLLGWVESRPEVQAKRTAWTLAYLQTWTPRDHMAYPELGQTWSLAVEMQYYVLWTAAVVAVVLLARRRPRQVLVAVALAGVALVAATRALRLLDGQNALILFPNAPNRLDGPLLGSLGGIAYASGWLDGLGERWAARLVAAGLLAFAALAVFADPFSDVMYLGGFTAVAAVGIVTVVAAAVLTRGVLAAVLGSPPLVALGKASYSAFLWHFPVFIVLAREADGWPVVLRAVVALLVTAALSTASYLAVERPIQRWRTRATGATVVTVPATPATPAAVDPATGVVVQAVEAGAGVSS